MDFFNVLTLFGGLAMFLYGMRLMGDNLKESSSGTFKVAMEHVTNNPVKAFLLGLAVTAIIQSSTATIVITSGLVGAGIITLSQSLGIIIGANVGTTVTGQIIRLLDLDGAAGWIRIFTPSSLAPIALIAGIILIMGFNLKNSKTIGNILIGFGILFSGLLSMTGSVNSLSETGIFDELFRNLGSNPLLGYLTGAGVAFVLQSSSATIGILQAFSTSGLLRFNAVYSVIVGVYLGDCVTTAIVCSIGANADARRVGAVNIMYNLSKSAAVLLGVGILHAFGVLDPIWNAVVNPGFIANTNTIFNLASAVILMPFIGFYEASAYRIIPDKAVSENKYKDKLEALNPVFFSTPALALRSCYDLLLTMLEVASRNITTSFELLNDFREDRFRELNEEENCLDLMTDSLSSYMASLSGHLNADIHVQILNEYYKIVTEYERLGDHAMNIAETGRDLAEKNLSFSDTALRELDLLHDLINRILNRTDQAFRRRDLNAAKEIEPLEEVVDDLVDALKTNHLNRLAKGKCNVYVGADFIDVLGDIERISDICSNVGLATITRIAPEIAAEGHDYIGFLHSGQDESFNQMYRSTHDEYFSRLDKLIDDEKRQDNLGLNKKDPSHV